MDPGFTEPGEDRDCSCDFCAREDAMLRSQYITFVYVYVCACSEVRERCVL